MTSEQKAQAWEWAAKLVENECVEMAKRGEYSDTQEYALTVVVTYMTRVACGIRSFSGAKRERGGK